MTDIERKTGMTDLECEYWDDYYTKNAFEPGPNLLRLGIKPGFARSALLLSELDKEVAEYVRERAKAFNKSHAAIINDIVREKLTVGA
ncbi:MAG: hypothetical protein FWC64_12300 [Treponema sp.]|nr:hypothetical protein [Treponema sp.]